MAGGPCCNPARAIAAVSGAGLFAADAAGGAVCHNGSVRNDTWA